MRAGLLVVKRYHWFRDQRVLAQTGPPRQPSVSLSHEEILQRFRGVEGDSWPDADGKPEVPLGGSGLVSPSMAADVRRYFDDVSSRQLCDLLFCVSSGDEGAIAVPEGFSFCGYDLSPGTSDLTCYSAVYNEVIYGLYPELRECSARLNGHLLLPSLAEVEGVLDLRERLGREGADLEDHGNRQAAAVIAIHGADRARGFA